MNARECIEKGHQFFQQKNYREADLYFSKALQKEAGNDMVYLLRGLNAKEAGDFDAAAAFYEEAIRINPAQEMYYIQLGEILLNTNRIWDAIKYYQKGTLLNPLYSAFSIHEDRLHYLHSAPSRGRDNNKHDPVCCVSFPKCGTHLLSDILQKVTGLESHWPESTSLDLDKLESIIDGSFLTGHFWPNLECYDYLQSKRYKLIVNYRDPRDQLISYYFYYSRIQKNGDNIWGRILNRFDKEQAIEALSTTSLAGGLAHPSAMSRWIDGWLEFARRGVPVLFVTYEDLVLQKADAVNRIGDFLGCALPQDTVSEIIDETTFHNRSMTLKNKGEADNTLKRKGKVGDWKNHFSRRNADVYNSVAGSLLEQLGYGPC